MEMSAVRIDTFILHSIFTIVLFAFMYFFFHRFFFLAELINFPSPILNSRFLFYYFRRMNNWKVICFFPLAQTHKHTHKHRVMRSTIITFKLEQFYLYIRWIEITKTISSQFCFIQRWRSRNRSIFHFL
jgi:hypothetical protein